MRLFGLIGYPLEHSFSASYFAQKFNEEGIKDCDYRHFPLSAIDELPHLLISYPGLHGLNVTVPYKQGVKLYLNAINGEAFAIGAVNTIKITHEGRDPWLKGFNTDVHGFRVSLEPLLGAKPKQALILGSGGSSLAVKHVLKQWHIPYWTVSRKNAPGMVTYDELTEDTIKRCQLIINTTPLGMYPKVSSCPPIPYNGLTDSHLLYDLVYNPSVTQFLVEGQKRGALIKNGYEMLKGQAERSWTIWNDPAF